jgi:hypothetical protein
LSVKKEVSTKKSKVLNLGQNPKLNSGQFLRNQTNSYWIKPKKKGKPNITPNPLLSCNPQEGIRVRTDGLETLI